MVLFTGFFGAAMVWRGRSEWHKPLIISATVVLAFAATGRAPLVLVPSFLRLLVWLSPLLIVVGIELFTRRRAHPILWICIAILFAAWFRGYLLQSEPRFSAVELGRLERLVFELQPVLLRRWNEYFSSAE
jgi:hypothetical protein